MIAEGGEAIPGRRLDSDWFYGAPGEIGNDGGNNEPEPEPDGPPICLLPKLTPSGGLSRSRVDFGLFAGRTISEENPPSQWERSNPKLSNVLARNESLEDWMPCLADNGGAVS